MTAEEQLAAALKAFAASRGVKLATGPTDELVIPSPNAGEYRVPMMFLFPDGA